MTYNDWLDFFEERAAIREYCANMPRDRAEVMARLDCINKWLEIEGKGPENKPDATADLRNMGIVK